MNCISTLPDVEEHAENKVILSDILKTYKSNAHPPHAKCDRNLALFLNYYSGKSTYKDLSSDFNLSKRRVRKICLNVLSQLHKVAKTKR